MVRSVSSSIRTPRRYLCRKEANGNTRSHSSVIRQNKKTQEVEGNSNGDGPQEEERKRKRSTQNPVAFSDHTKQTDGGSATKSQPRLDYTGGLHFVSNYSSMSLIPYC